MIELELGSDSHDLKMGDTIILNDDGTFQIKKSDGTIIQKPFAGYTNFAACVAQNKDKGNPEAYCGAIKHKVEDTKKEDTEKVKDTEKESDSQKYDPRIEKYLSISKERAWDILNKIYKSGHLDTYSILKEVLNKVATCPNVTDKFEKIMENWMKDGEADTASIEKIINACKSEGGNIDKSDKIIEALRR